MGKYKDREITEMRLHAPLFVGGVNTENCVVVGTGPKQFQIELTELGALITSSYNKKTVLTPYSNICGISLGPILTLVKNEKNT